MKRGDDNELLQAELDLGIEIGEENGRLREANAELAAGVAAFLAYDDCRDVSGFEFLRLYNTALTQCRTALGKHTQGGPA